MLSERGENKCRNKIQLYAYFLFPATSTCMRIVNFNAASWIIDTIITHVLMIINNNLAGIDNNITELLPEFIPFTY